MTRAEYDTLLDVWIAEMPDPSNVLAYGEWVGRRPVEPVFEDAPPSTFLEMELCDACMEHIILEAEHKICNTLCRPPIHTGGGTIGPTQEWQEGAMWAAWDKHNNQVCCEVTCKEGHK